SPPRRSRRRRGDQQSGPPRSLLLVSVTMHSRACLRESPRAARYRDRPARAAVLWGFLLEGYMLTKPLIQRVYSDLDFNCEALCVLCEKPVRRDEDGERI